MPIHISDIAEDLLPPPTRLCRRSGSSATDSPHCSAGGITTAQSNRDGYPRRQSWTKTSRESHHFARHFCAQVVFAFRKWRRTLLRFKPKAAKGADGFALADLRNMSDQQVTFLPSLLTNIEQGNSQWPIQWLGGFVIAISDRLPPITDPSCCFLWHTDAGRP